MTVSFSFKNDPPKIFALGFSFWKKPILRDFFPNSKIFFVNHHKKIPDQATVVVWGAQSLPQEMLSSISLLRLEDGFLRSIGLGVDLIRPVSWIVDFQGIYFDARRPSDLEILLSEHIFPQELLIRAEKLRYCLIETQITKYNVSCHTWNRPDTNKKIILVPGQVETDASLTYGAPGIKDNLTLLKTVRAENPDAYLVYKPHPDVVARLRAKSEAEEYAQHWCDEYLMDVSMGQLLTHIDEIHVMTSLAGFEALLRNKKVVCYGQPFYAGWGLTHDKISIARRQRKLSLAELVAGCLIIYPRYMDNKTGKLISPEEAICCLLSWRDKTQQKTPWWRKGLRIMLRHIVGIR